MIKAIPDARVEPKRQARKAGIRGAGSARKGAVIRKRLTVLLLIGLLIECAAGAVTSPHFYIRNVRVAGIGGLRAHEADETIAALRVAPKSGIARFDSDAMISRLESLPWVQKAEVYRRLPGTISVRIRRRSAFAVALMSGRHWEVDESGMVIRRGARNPQIPLIQLDTADRVEPGKRIGDETFAHALLVARALGSRPAAACAKIAVDSHAQMCLNMADGIEIRLGRATELEAKLSLVEQIYREQPDIASRVEQIDLTAPESPACRPISGSRKALSDGANPGH